MLDSEKMKERREELGLTQEEAAKKAGFGSRQRWNDIESGRKPNVSIETLEQIAKTLGMSARDLLKDDSRRRSRPQPSVASQDAVRPTRRL